MICINNLRKSFGRNHVLKGIDIEFRDAGITAILGPNGSGKTTLIKSILGMVLPDTGNLLFNGSPIKNKWNYRNSIDYLPQIARFPENLKVNELIHFVKDLRGGKPSDRELIDYFELQPHLNTPTGQLSGGTRQKLNLVIALMYNSPVLILDEPTAGLDPVALIRLKELLEKEKNAGKIILVTTHIMSFVEEMADQLVFLLDGNIHFRGSLASLKSKYGEMNLERAIAKILLREEEATTKMNGQTTHLPNISLTTINR